MDSTRTVEPLRGEVWRDKVNFPRVPHRELCAVTIGHPFTGPNAFLLCDADVHGPEELRLVVEDDMRAAIFAAWGAHEHDRRIAADAIVAAAKRWHDTGPRVDPQGAEEAEGALVIAVETLPEYNK